MATAHAVNVLWTSTVPSDPPNVNHFVPLSVMQPGDSVSQFYDVKQLQLESTAATQSQCIDLTCDDAAADAALIGRDDDSDGVDDNSRRSDAAADERDAEDDDVDDGHSHPSQPIGQQLDGPFSVYFELCSLLN